MFLYPKINVLQSWYKVMFNDVELKFNASELMFKSFEYTFRSFEHNLLLDKATISWASVVLLH